MSVSEKNQCYAVISLVLDTKEYIYIYRIFYTKDNYFDDYCM